MNVKIWKILHAKNPHEQKMCDMEVFANVRSYCKYFPVARREMHTLSQGLIIVLSGQWHYLIPCPWLPCKFSSNNRKPLRVITSM